jgi:hypothetical protein
VRIKLSFNSQTAFPECPLCEAPSTYHGFKPFDISYGYAVLSACCESGHEVAIFLNEGNPNSAPPLRVFPMAQLLYSQELLSQIPDSE